MTKSKIFCIGLSRTGTVSICEALEILGYHTLHFSLGLFVNQNAIDDNLHFEPRQRLGLYESWQRNRELSYINRVFDRSTLENYAAFGDLPIPLFYKELDQKFPRSKFIYTYRDEQKWLKSMKWLYETGAVLWKHGYIDDEIKYAAYTSFRYDEEVLLKAYRKHHKDVLDYFKDREDDILYLNIDKKRITFKPLCSFLNEPLPDEDYPVSNAAKSVGLMEKINYRMTRTIPFYGMFKRKLFG